MKKINGKLRLHFLLLIGCTTFLFFSGMTSPVKIHAQQSLLDSTSVKINGENWTFRTPPPPISQRKVISSHPRLYLTQASLPGIREKLADPIYANDMSVLNTKANKGDALAAALLYQLEGDVNGRGTAAKNWLLSGTFGDIGGLDKVAEWFEPILVFDWVIPLLSSSEKSSAFERIKLNFLYEGAVYDHRTAAARDWTLFWTRSWARHPGMVYPILALAIAGDGIDDTWAQEVLDLAYNESPLVVGPYGATKGGGFLDILATISLDDGGGIQAGSEGFLGANYMTYFLHSFMFLQAWETSTNQPMWSRNEFFRKLPSNWAYQRSRIPAALGTAMPELLTGIYRDIDPNTAGLASWMVDKWGRTGWILVHRLILGDLRVPPKSPKELGLPTATYLRGTDMFVSSRSWDEDAITVTALSRYSDTSRYEPASGVFAIHRGAEPFAVPSNPLKEWISEGHFSGLWFYDPNDVLGTMRQKSTYWSTSRAFEAYKTVSDPAYFPGGPDQMVINDTYRGISTEYAKQLRAPGVQLARQTIVHILDTNRDFIVVYNYTDVPPNLKRAWSMRLAVPPSIHENGFTIPGMTTTVVAPSSNTMSWVGGLGDEMKSPPPEKVWYGNTKGAAAPGYSSNPKNAKAMGIGNLFVQPDNNAPEQLEFLVVIQVSDLTPVAVSRVSDREANFGGWNVSFSSDGSFNVIPPDGTIIDSAPPTAPSNLKIQ